MGLDKNTEVVGMLYGFRITPPGFQEGRQTLYLKEPIEAIPECQRQTATILSETGAENEMPFLRDRNQVILALG